MRTRHIPRRSSISSSWLDRRTAAELIPLKWYQFSAFASSVSSTMHKLVFLFIVFFGSTLQAGNLSESYWSPSGCEGYVYYIDDTNAEYKIYTHLEIVSSQRGAIDSYQMTEGKIVRISKYLYLMESKDIDGGINLDASDPNELVLKSEQYGKSYLRQCSFEEVKNLIIGAKKHFEKCGKNTLNCKSD